MLVVLGMLMEFNMVVLNIQGTLLELDTVIVLGI